ncbi:hypothetical protein E4U55_001041 [Claviceps digitariae]|nr:hypothetical protein E4U55_001041 [Claviceps digitariae]
MYSTRNDAFFWKLGPVAHLKFKAHYAWMGADLREQESWREEWIRGQTGDDEEGAWLIEVKNKTRINPFLLSRNPLPDRGRVDEGEMLGLYIWQVEATGKD